MIKQKSAFTLVEVLVAMSLMVLVGGVLYLIQSTGMSTVKKGSTRLILTSEARNKIEYLVRDLRNAKEILEVSGDSIKIRTFSSKKTGTGDETLVTVQYEVERREKNCVFWRIENKENPQSLITVEKIGEEIFVPYYERPEENSVTGWTYVPYDLKSNDSGLRPLITFVKINLSFENAGEKVSIVTSATLRPAKSRLQQPNWKLR